MSSVDSTRSVRVGVSGKHRPLRMPRCKSTTVGGCAENGGPENGGPEYAGPTTRMENAGPKN